MCTHGGKRNRIEFDSSKEHLIIIHPLVPEGDNFKLLGTLIDPKLSMEPAIESILSRCRPKVKAILRTRRFYSIPDLLMQFKTHIWGLCEHHNGAIYHAAQSHLGRLDNMQRGFLHELGISEKDAFLNHNFAPLSLRREIELLGFLHKRVLNQCHPAIAATLPFATHTTNPEWHTRQLYNHSYETPCRVELFKRSILALVGIYNRLPQNCVDSPNVMIFQRTLTRMAKAFCEHDHPRWKVFLSPRSVHFQDGQFGVDYI